MEMALFRFLLLMSIVVLGLGLECKPPETRDSQTLEKRAKEPRYVVYGTVISAKMQTPTNRSVDEEYEFLIEPLCWLKRGQEAHSSSDCSEDDSGEMSGDATNSTDPGDTGLQNITVTEDKIADCVYNDFKMDRQYILFLKKYGGGKYKVYDVNEESGAIGEPNDEAFEAVYRGISACLQGRPEAECKEGVAIPCFVGDDNRDVCSKGAALGVAVWALALPAVVALAGYFSISK